MRIISLSDAVERRGPKILVYGRSGAGKTSLVPTLPGRKLVASAEHGLLSISGAADVDVVEVKTIGDLREVRQYMASSSCEYDWLALDSMTEIAEVLLRDRKEAASDPRQAYGAVAEEIAAISRSLRDLQCGVLCLAHEKHTRREMPVGKDIVVENYYAPLLPGSVLSTSIPHHYDHVFRLHSTPSGQRRVQTMDDGYTTAKSRGWTLKKIEDATHGLGAILDKIDGGKRENPVDDDGAQ